MPDLLVGPHGIDRYLELIRPNLTLREARAEVVGVRRQTDRSVTLTLRPNLRPPPPTSRRLPGRRPPSRRRAGSMGRPV